MLNTLNTYNTLLSFNYVYNCNIHNTMVWITLTNNNAACTIFMTLHVYGGNCLFLYFKYLFYEIFRVQPVWRLFYISGFWWTSSGGNKVKIQLKYILLCISSAKVKKKDNITTVTDYQWQSKPFRPRKGPMESISLNFAVFRFNDMNACFSSRNQKEGLNSDTRWKTDLIQEEKDKPLVTGLLLQLCSKICPAHFLGPHASESPDDCRQTTDAALILGKLRWLGTTPASC